MTVALGANVVGSGVEGHCVNELVKLDAWISVLASSTAHSGMGV